MDKIILIDDDQEFTGLLQKLLAMEGFTVNIAYDSDRLNILDSSINLLMIDITGKNDGDPLIDTLKEVRKQHKIPVIILKYSNNDRDRDIHIELVVTDSLSLPKPFNETTILARIIAIIRLSCLWSNHTLPLKVDSLSLNPGKQEAIFNSMQLEITGTEFNLLYLLAKNIGQVVSREYLSQAVLGKRLTPFDRAIDMHISNLRRKLPKRTDGYPWFKTLRGKGYLMVSSN